MTVRDRLMMLKDRADPSDVTTGTLPHPFPHTFGNGDIGAAPDVDRHKHDDLFRRIIARYPTVTAYLGR